MIEPHQHAPCPRTRWLAWWISLGVGLLLAIGTVYWVVLLKHPVGVEGQWVIRRGALQGGFYPPDPVVGLPPLAVVLALGGLAALCAHWARRATPAQQRLLVIVALGSLILMAVCLQWQLCSFSNPPPGLLWVVASVYSPVSCEYFETAYRYPKALDLTRQYVDVMRYSRDSGHFHVATHPPGAVLVYRLGIDLIEAMPRLENWLTRYIQNAAGCDLRAIEGFALSYPHAPILPRRAVVSAVWCAFLCGAMGALGIVPVYLLGARLWGREAGLAGAGLYALVPSQVLYFPLLDPLVATVAATCLVLAVEGMTRGKLICSGIAGAILGLGLFVSFGLLPLALLFIAYALMNCISEGRTVARPTACHVGVFAAAIAVVQALLALIFRTQPLAILQFGLATHGQISALFGRQYGLWVGLNLVEFGLFVGWPLFALLLWRIGAAAAMWWRERRIAQVDALAAATLITLLLVDLSGRVRAETGRIWLFLTPPLIAWVAAGSVTNGTGGWWRVAALAGAMVFTLFTLAASLVPVVRPY